MQCNYIKCAWLKYCTIAKITVSQASRKFMNYMRTSLLLNDFVLPYIGIQ